MAKFSLGVRVKCLGDIRAPLEKVKALGLNNCQMSFWKTEDYTIENAKLLKETAAEMGIEITMIWLGWPGPVVWDFVEGPIVLGLVPPEYRASRAAALKMGSDFAREVGVKKVATHLGFIPEYPADPKYPGFIATLRDVARYCQANGQDFCFETGQDTPITLLRVIKDLRLNNIGINFDPANLLVYGKANPEDALDIFGQYVKGVHAKDGEYPVEPDRLGKETPIGEGRVNFPVIMKKLKQSGYEGAITIEREIGGPQQIEDIKKSIAYLRPML